MTLYRIYAKMIASRRYQVMAAYETANPEVAAHVYRPGQADWYMGPRDPEIALLSPRPYPKGCIINPTTVIRELIAARREA